jgi:hypothetical protein
MLGHCCPSVAIDCLSIRPAPRHRTEQHSLSVRAARAPLPNRKYTALKNMAVRSTLPKKYPAQGRAIC